MFLARWNGTRRRTAWERGHPARVPCSAPSRRASRGSAGVPPAGCAGVLPARSDVTNHGIQGVPPSVAPQRRDLTDREFSGVSWTRTLRVGYQEAYRDRFLGSSYVSSSVLVIRTPKLPLLPQGRQKRTGMQRCSGSLACCDQIRYSRRCQQHQGGML